MTLPIPPKSTRYVCLRCIGKGGHDPHACPKPRRYIHQLRKKKTVSLTTLASDLLFFAHACWLASRTVNQLSFPSAAVLNKFKHLEDVIRQQVTIHRLLQSMGQLHKTDSEHENKPRGVHGSPPVARPPPPVLLLLLIRRYNTVHQSLLRLLAPTPKKGQTSFKRLSWGGGGTVVPTSRCNYLLVLCVVWLLLAASLSSSNF